MQKQEWFKFSSSQMQKLYQLAAEKDLNKLTEELTPKLSKEELEIYDLKEVIEEPAEDLGEFNKFLLPIYQ